MKSWAADVRAHVATWTVRLKKTGRGWWPRFAYHFTDVQNAWRILNSGVLLSRAEAIAAGQMVNDNADPRVIGQTDPDHLRFVRLFFRPRTPTQYHVEGIKRRGRRGTGHCPMPVFFLFDLVDLICRDDVCFSRGTMASVRHGYSDRREYFRSIPFADVYHDEGLGIIETVRKRDIIQARQAEVLVPRRLPLGSELKAICCRSQAERVTLLNGLSREARQKWRKRIRTGVDGLFFRFHPYVLSVSGTDRHTVAAEFGRSSLQELEVEFEFVSEDGRRYRSDAPLPARTDRKLYRLPRPESAGLLKLSVEGCLAFRGHVILEDLPF